MPAQDNIEGPSRLLLTNVLLQEVHPIAKVVSHPEVLVHPAEGLRKPFVREVL